MYFFSRLCIFVPFDGTQARNLRTSTSLIAYGARGVKNWLFSHWVLYRQMGHLWMEETYRPPFSAFKDSLIAYFILSFFPKRHLAPDPKHLCMPTHFSMIFLRNERLASQFWACPFVAEKILVFCHLCHTYLAPEKVTGMLPFFRATIVI